MNFIKTLDFCMWCEYYQVFFNFDKTILNRNQCIVIQNTTLESEREMASLKSWLCYLSSSWVSLYKLLNLCECQFLPPEKWGE